MVSHDLLKKKENNRGYQFTYKGKKFYECVKENKILIEQPKLFLEPNFYFGAKIRKWGLNEGFKVPDEQSLRMECVKKMIEREMTTNKVFYLLATSGNSYLAEDGIIWMDILGKYLNSVCKINVIIQSPFSAFSITRAMANEKEKHLWEESIGIIRYQELLSKFKNKIEIKVTDHPINCSLFFTSDSVLFDPYIWGRPNKMVPTENCFWVFEFKNNSFLLLKSHFDFLNEHSVIFEEFYKPTMYEKLSKNFSIYLKNLKNGNLDLSMIQQFNPMIQDSNQERKVLSFFDTWISIDPIQGCPNNCTYCVLRLYGLVDQEPKIIIDDPNDCIKLLLNYRFFIRNVTPLSIGNRTDMFARQKNINYLEQFHF